MDVNLFKMELEKFASEFNIHDLSTTRLCLGGDVYISISYFRSDYKIHIRRFNSVSDTHNPEKVFMFPSKTGLVLSISQLNKLMNAIPTIVSVVDAQRDVADTSAGPSTSGADGARDADTARASTSAETPMIPDYQPSFPCPSVPSNLDNFIPNTHLFFGEEYDPLSISSQGSTLQLQPETSNNTTTTTTTTPKPSKLRLHHPESGMASNDVNYSIQPRQFYSKYSVIFWR